MQCNEATTVIKLTLSIAVYKEIVLHASVINDIKFLSSFSLAKYLKLSQPLNF